MSVHLPRLRRALLPVVVFAAVAAGHYIWHGLFPERDAVQAAWLTLPANDGATWAGRYIETQAYWLGYSYALSLAFAAIALRRYREQHSCGARNLAIGGVTFSGFLAVAGCFLLGCCGSPMLAVYLSLFGSSFLPFARPLVATLTTITIIGGYFWMERRSLSAARVGCTSTTDPSCHCD